MRNNKFEKENGSLIYLFIIEKKSIKNSNEIGMPKHYTDSIRDESRMGYAVLAKVMFTYFNIQYNPEDIAVTKYGKPYFRTNNVHFNLSNCRDYIVCVIANEEVGVDIEQTDRKIKTQLLGKILNPEEINDSIDPLKAWVVKEAYSKYLGTGTRLGFEKVTATNLQKKHPNFEITQESFICSLFYQNPNSRIQVSYTLEGFK